MRALFLAGLLVAGSIPATSAIVIARDARIFVEAGSGFDIYLTAALEKKHIPLVVTTARSEADYALEGVADRDGEAGVRLVDLRTGNVIFAYSAAGKSALRSRRIAAEACAKNLAATLVSPPRGRKSSLKSKARELLLSKDPALDF